MASDEQLPHRDHAQALRIAGGSELLAADLYGQFRQQLPAALQQLETLQQRQDWPALREALHRLSGASAACALPRLAQALDDFGVAARNADAAGCLQHLDALRDAARQLPNQIG